MKYVHISGLILILLFVSCKNNKKEVVSDDSKTEQTLKDISELSYQEIFYLLHSEEEYGIDYHGEAFGQDASHKVILVNLASDGCGNGVALRSTEDKMTLQAAVKISFRFLGNPANEMYRLYSVKPEETIPVGHSKLCYNGSEYIIQREIVSAGFEEQNED
ncbi:hypothetical protein [Flagellimonas nanhaiensis]|uniref:Lipoprotein n=1 Tax=Flagellimonas nanhaiensis TaxID=2292706 RepID=A0A371JQH0_9FLAO|nr:hypothetical protein [Allomuricauda nanhaiensis]RDY59762.1 hypothetical protein DX873_10390 [Allomuricauda nanhaiensis]